MIFLEGKDPNPVGPAIVVTTNAQCMILVACIIGHFNVQFRKTMYIIHILKYMIYIDTQF